MDIKSNKSFINGAIWLTLSTVLLKIIGVIYKVPISYLLGDEGMGTFNSAYTVYTLFYIVGSSGIPRAISIVASKSEAEKSGSSYSIYKTAIYSLGLIGYLLSVFLFTFARELSSIIGNTASFLSILAISPTVMFVTLSGVLRGYFSGRMSFAPIAISELIASVSKLVFGLLFAYIGVRQEYSLELTCAFSIFGMTVGSFLGLIYLYIVHKCKYKKLSSTSFEFKHIKKILRLSFPLTLASILTCSVNILDLSMIMNGLADKGYSYVVASVLYGNYTTLTVPMIGLATALISPFTTSMQPILTKNYACSDGASAEINLKSCFRSVAFITVPMSVIFLGSSADILSVIFEKESAILAAPTLSLISPSLYFLGVATVINMSLEADGKTVVPMLSLAFGAIIKFFVGLVLINNSELEILSAPIGTAISYFATFLFSFSYYNLYKKNRVIPFCGITKPLFISAFSFTVMFLLKNMFNINVGNRFYILTLLGVYGAIYLILSLILSKNTCFKNINESKMHKKINV